MSISRFNVILLLFLVGANPLMANENSISGEPAGQKLEEVSNPHWEKDGCRVCHSQIPAGKNTDLQLKSDSKLDLCYQCHEPNMHSRIHPSLVEASDKLVDVMPYEFQQSLILADGKVNCISCHDTTIQCRLNAVYRQKYFPGFIRGYPYASRTEFCFNCHVKSNYKPLIAHDQLNDQGQINEKRCMLCHLEVPIQLESGETEKTELIVEEDWETICVNCHTDIPHPSASKAFSRGKDTDHTVVPSAKVLARLSEMTRGKDIDLPLDSTTGKVTCATCHNPHEKGVIKSVSGTKGSENQNKLRDIPICTYCHKR